MEPWQTQHLSKMEAKRPRARLTRQCVDDKITRAFAMGLINKRGLMYLYCAVIFIVDLVH